ncbi:unnamed protein product [Protopolystoma xenopodis]|uniref:Bestrophin homolog n=1 Tax=Protopolystoma xenopodis TaxID=117903 RepID=A0A3S5B753_9PLAT|nr:unnamed protein product [Protopolystoma xenopodis]
MFKRSVDFLSSRPNRSSTSWTHQIQDPSIDLYLPIFTLLELVFYDGWLKIAQALVNPFGTEDSDFDLVALSERNYLIGLWFTSLTNSRYLEPAVIEHQCFGWTGLKRPSFSRQTTTSSMSRFDKSNKSDVVLDSGHVDVETDGIKQESQTEDDQSDFTYISKEPDEIYQLPASLSSLRRSESKYFLAGSIARLTKEAESRQHQSRAELGHGAIN